MAEAIVILEKRRTVFGHLRAVAAKSAIFAAAGDTWTVPGIRRIEQVNLVQTTPTIVSITGFSVAGNVVTLNTSGPGPAMTFMGAVTGI
jgi:hypothetical protein